MFFGFDIWKKGRVLDLWSIPHFLFGVLFACVPFLVPLTLATTFLIMLGIALVWEMLEWFVGIRETVWNNISDVLLPCISFYVTTEALLYYNVLREQLYVFFGAVLSVYLFTNISGWMAYRKRNREFTD